jgi:hypothetical protein
MRESTGFATSSPRVRRFALGAVAGVLAGLVLAAPASATLRVESFNDPVGDRTQMTYRITGGTLPTPIVVALPIGEGTNANESSYGPPPGVYVIQGVPAAGWRVADIQCVSSVSPSVFTIDVPNGRVAVNHGGAEDDTCAFTNRPISASAAPGAAAAPGVAPSPPAEEVAGVPLPRKAAVLRVVAGRGFASATVRVTRASIIKGQLLWRNNRVVGSVRVVRTAGSHVVRVTVKQSMRRLLARQKQPVRLTLRLVVSPRAGGTVQVFRFGVRVRIR